MRARRVLGAVALGALAAAAASFAVVDVSTSAVKSCAGSVASCGHEALPMLGLVFTFVGIGALVLAAAPAIAWIVLSLRGARAERDRAHADQEEADRAAARALRPSASLARDESSTATSRILGDAAPAAESEADVGDAGGRGRGSRRR